MNNQQLWQNLEEAIGVFLESSHRLEGALLALLENHKEKQPPTTKDKVKIANAVSRGEITINEARQMLGMDEI